MQITNNIAYWENTDLVSTAQSIADLINTMNERN
jgi:hypothetical protein